LLYHLLQSVDQAATGQSKTGALTNTEDRLLILCGHDTNLVSIAGALHLNWIVDGRKDDTPPGGALVFELWKMPGAGDFEVRTYYIAQTLDQMRYATPLSLATPLLRLPVFIPGCGRADGSCTLTGFQKILDTAIDRDFVK
jgi:4-phytase/acid phosphatase